MTTVDLTDPVAVLRQLGALHLEIESIHDLMAECERRLEAAGHEYDDLAPFASIYVNDGAVPIMASCPLLPIEDWAAIKRQAQESGRSASAIMRELVAAHLRGTVARKTRTKPSRPPAA